MKHRRGLKGTPAETQTVELYDEKSEVYYHVTQRFIDRVLDFKNSLNGRQPTRRELRELVEEEHRCDHG